MSEQHTLNTHEGGGTTPGIMVGYKIRGPQIHILRNLNCQTFGFTTVSHKRFRLPNSVVKISPCVPAHLKAVIPTDV